MKLNKILMVLAATAIVGCTSEDLNDFNAKQAPEDSRMIELDQNFVLAGVGVDGAMTRTHWELTADKALVNKFLPIYDVAATDGSTTLDNWVDELQQAVGLCWLGTNETPGTDVYTNYQFYHFGWLNVDETEAKVECNKLLNGAMYDEIKATDASAGIDDEVDPTKFTTIPTKSAIGLNYNSGVYKTDNKAIFGGDYIVYYPFNKAFNEAGTIPALAVTEFNPAPIALTDKALGKATFRYSGKVTIEGGDQAAGFGLHNLSSLVQLKVYAPDNDPALAAGSERKVDQIVLYSPSEKLLKQANLAADKIAEGKKGAELYAETKGTKTISAKFGTAVELKAKTAADPGAFITVLPTKVEDLKVLVHSVKKSDGSDGKWATIDKANTEFKAGSAKVLEISVANADWKADYIAVDQTSLQTALAEARVVAVDADHATTIKVIGDIKLTADLNINAGNDKFITITGDDIIVPEAVTLNLNTNMESDVRVLGKSCCSAAATGGRLRIIGGTVNNVTMEPAEAKVTDLTYDAYSPRTTFVDAGTAVATIAAGKTFDVQAGNVDVDKAVQHKGNIKIAEGAKLTVTGTADGKHGDIQFMGCTVENNGTIEVKKGGKFDMTDADGNAHASDGQRMTNNGKFIHNVDAGVGTAVQSMTQNGEYRCKVNKQEKLNDAFLQWTACSVIEMVEAGAEYDLGTAAGIKVGGVASAYKHKGKYINIEVNTTSGTTFVNKKDNNVIEIGDLTVIQSGLNVNYKLVDGTTTYRRTLKVHGDMTVKAATTLSNSKQIIITDVDANGENKGNLAIEGATLTYAGNNANVNGLAVAKDITVSKAGNFNASDLNAIKISCANFYLANDKTANVAHFGNRTGGLDKTMTVTGTISNPKDCTFDIVAAADPNLLAWITCSELLVGGTFTGARPIVE